MNTSGSRKVASAARVVYLQVWPFLSPARLLFAPFPSTVFNTAIYITRMTRTDGLLKPRFDRSHSEVRLLLPGGDLVQKESFTNWESPDYHWAHTNIELLFLVQSQALIFEFADKRFAELTVLERSAMAELIDYHLVHNILSKNRHFRCFFEVLRPNLSLHFVWHGEKYWALESQTYREPYFSDYLLPEKAE